MTNLDQLLQGWRKAEDKYKLTRNRHDNYARNAAWAALAQAWWEKTGETLTKAEAKEMTNEQ